MAIEIFFQNCVQGNDIRGCAFHINDYFHEFLIHHCSIHPCLIHDCADATEYPLLEALSFIDDEASILIPPESLNAYSSELEKLITVFNNESIGQGWEAICQLIQNLQMILQTDKALENGLKCFLDE